MPWNASAGARSRFPKASITPTRTPGTRSLPRPGSRPAREAVVAELEASKRLFVAAAREVPDEKFEEGRAAHRILTGTGTNHYREHAPAIAAWRKQEGI